jgi:hypothetical protein
VLFCSISAVKCNFGCIELKLVRMAYMSLYLGKKSEECHLHIENDL